MSIKTHQPRVFGETEGGKPLEVRDLDRSHELSVGEYSPRQIGSLQRDSRLNGQMGRFKLNSLQRATLGIDEEERQKFEDEIQRRVSEGLAALREQTLEEARRDGLELGRKEARDEFAAEKLETQNALRAVVSSFEGAAQDVFKQNERFLLHLAAQIAKSVALKEVETDETYLSRLFQSVIEKIGIRDHIRIKIHPKDEKAAFAMKQDLESKNADLRNLAIEASEDVQQGGCVVETDWNSVDARIETQIKEIINGLAQGEGGSGHGMAAE